MLWDLWVPAWPSSCALCLRSLPVKTRQDHITDVQVTFPGILSYGSHPFEDLSYDARRHNDTNIVVKQNVLLGVLEAACWSADLAHRVERSRYGRALPVATDGAELGLEDGFDVAEVLNDAVIGASKMVTGGVWNHHAILREVIWIDDVIARP